MSRWVTISGRRVFIDDGGSVIDGIYFNAKRSREKFQKHGKEFEDSTTLQDYIQKAYSLFDRRGVNELKLTDGRHYKYDQSTNEFLLVENNRVTTFFRPKLGMRYWELKQQEYKELVRV